MSLNQNRFTSQQICNTVTWEQFSWSIQRYACWYIRKQVQHDWSIVETYFPALNLFKKCVTWVTAITAFVFGVFSSNQLVLWVLQALQVSFSIFSHEINQRNKCYKRYRLHFLCPLNIYTSVTSVTAPFNIYSNVTSVTSVTAFILDGKWKAVTLVTRVTLETLVMLVTLENEGCIACIVCNTVWFDERSCIACNTCNTG